MTESAHTGEIERAVVRPVALDASPVDILIVDDRTDDIAALAALLDDPGYHLVSATSGVDALRRVLDHDFAVILLDVMMPTMDGFEVAAMIKQRERSCFTPILFMTAAHQDAEVIYRAYSVGAVDYLVKPIEKAVVQAKVRTFAELFRKDRQIREQAQALREADRRQRDLELAELRLLSEKRYRSLVETIPASVWTADPSGAVDYCNHRWFELTGLRLEESIGPSWLQVVHPGDVARVTAGWEEAIAAGSDYVDELRLRRADGSYRWHLCHAVPDKDRRDQVRGWLGLFADCQELKNAVEVRDEFLSIASHELKTPLNALQLYVHGLARVLAGIEDPPPKLSVHVSGIERQVQRMTRLIDQLLDVTRIMAGKLALEPARMELGELVREVVDGLREAAHAAGSEVQLDVAEGITGDWDRSRIDQVVANLVTNALKFGAGRPVRVVVGQTASSARIQVVDLGIGIEPEDQARIFGRFERAVSGREFTGFGLGLWIVRQIVEAHGGTVAVESRPGEGAAFTVDLPRTPVESLAEKGRVIQ